MVSIWLITIFDGLVQDCSNSIANALELVIWTHRNKTQSAAREWSAAVGVSGFAINKSYTSNRGAGWICGEQNNRSQFTMTTSIGIVRSPMSPRQPISLWIMMTSSNGNSFRVTCPLFGEFTGHRWISPTKASDVELWGFLWSAPEPTVGQTPETPEIWDANALTMTLL